MPERKTLNLFYYFPNRKNLLVLSVVLLPLLTILDLEYYEYQHEIIVLSLYVGILFFIPLGAFFALVFFVKKAPFKIHLWILYIGVMCLLTVITETIVWGRQVQLTFQNAIPITEALNAYKKDTGHYPSKLSELTKKYLEEIPITSIGVFSTKKYGYYSSDGNSFHLFFPSHSIDNGVYMYHIESRSWYIDD